MNINVELTDGYYSYDRRCPLYIERDIIGICDICGEDIYENEHCEYKSIYNMVHTDCKREQLREFIGKYNARSDYEPKRFKITRWI